MRFGYENERSQAMTEINGAYCSTRPKRISAATPRKSSGYQQQYSSHGKIIISHAFCLHLLKGYKWVLLCSLAF